MIRKTAAVLAVAALLLTGCEPERSTPKPKPQPRPAGGGGNAGKPNPTINAPGPAADPGQCARGEEARQVQLEALWLSETEKGPDQVLWWHNLVATPATNLSTTKADRGYAGQKSTLVTVKCGDTVGVEIVGSRSMYQAICMVSDLGQDKVSDGQRNCRAMYTVP